MKTLAWTPLLVMLAVAFAGCSDRDDGLPGASPSPAGETTSPSATRPGTATATTTPTATPMPGRELAERLAQSPEYFVYVVGPGDTVPIIADMFDGVGVGPDAAFEDELREANELDDATSLPIGYELAIPLRLPAADSLFQSNSIQEALRAGTADRTPDLLVPNDTLRSGLGGRVALHRLQVADGNTPGEGRGYYAIYSSTDRIAVKAGELDRSAQVVGEAFATAGGVLVAKLLAEHSGSVIGSVHNIDYAVAVIGEGIPDAGTVAANLEPGP